MARRRSNRPRWPQQHQIVVPALARLDLRGNGFAADSTAAVVDCVGASPALEECRLDGNAMDRACAASFGIALKDPLCALTTLSLSGCQIDGDHAAMILHSLHGNDLLTSLNLNGGGFPMALKSLPESE